MLVVLKPIYMISIKKDKIKHQGEILKLYLGHKNKPLCFASCDFSPFNSNIILLLCHYLIKNATQMTY